MKSFRDWLKEQTVLKLPEGPKGSIQKIIAIISHMDSKDIEECKTDLFNLRDLIDQMLSGGL